MDRELRWSVQAGPMIHDYWSMIDIRHFVLESDAIWMNPPKSSPIKLIYIIDLFRIQI